MPKLASGSQAAQQHPVLLLVEDDGKGWDTEILTAASPTVTGHGLSNMQKRMEQLGGRFIQQSKSGQGTIVRLELPVRNQ
jgi:signal transduction histidine kinase